jgi:hypothetical protein
MDDLLHQLESALVAVFASCDDVGLALPNEPLSLDLKKLPIVTLKWLGPDAVDYETGGGQDITHTWRIYIYGEARKLDDAWEDLKTVAVQLVRALRNEPTLGDLAAITSLRREEEPDVVKRGTQLVGQMTLLFSATGVDLA